MLFIDVLRKYYDYCFNEDGEEPDADTKVVLEDFCDWLDGQTDSEFHE